MTPGWREEEEPAREVAPVTAGPGLVEEDMVWRDAGM